MWGLWHDGAFYFSSDFESRKAKNIAANPALAMHLESGDACALLGVEECIVAVPARDALPVQHRLAALARPRITVVGIDAVA